MLSDSHGDNTQIWWMAQVHYLSQLPISVTRSPLIFTDYPAWNCIEEITTTAMACFIQMANMFNLQI